LTRPLRTSPPRRGRGLFGKLEIFLVRYKYRHLEVTEMKKKAFFIILLVLGLLGATYSVSVHAQKPTGTLTLLYSNNINGEIEPCPT
jgi:hypothetical protein